MNENTKTLIKHNGKMFVYHSITENQKKNDLHYNYIVKKCNEVGFNEYVLKTIEPFTYEYTQSFRNGKRLSKDLDGSDPTFTSPITPNFVLEDFKNYCLDNKVENIHINEFGGQFGGLYYQTDVVDFNFFILKENINVWNNGVLYNPLNHMDKQREWYIVKDDNSVVEGFYTHWINCSTVPYKN
jgi:hypothetical protein